MPLSRELVRAVRERVAAEPGLAPGLLAAELGVPEEQVVTALPVAMRTRARLDDVPAIWAALAALPGRRVVRGPERATAGEGGFPGRRECVGSAWFMAGRPGAEPEVRFLDAQGRELFTVLPPPGGGAVFDALRERHGVTPAPKVRCKGCPHCTCAKASRPTA